MPRIALFFCTFFLIFSCKKAATKTQLRSEVDDLAVENSDPYAEAIEAMARVHADVEASDDRFSIRDLTDASGASGLALNESAEDNLKADLGKVAANQERVTDESERAKATAEAELKATKKYRAEEEEAKEKRKQLESFKDNLCVIGDERRGCQCKAVGLLDTEPTSSNRAGQRVESEVTLALPSISDLLTSPENREFAKKYPGISMAPSISSQIFQQTCRLAIMGLSQKASGGKVSLIRQSRTLPGRATTEEACLCQTTDPPKSLRPSQFSKFAPAESFYDRGNLPVLKMACMQPYRVLAGPESQVEDPDAEFGYGASVVYLAGRASENGDFDQMVKTGCTALTKRWEQDCIAYGDTEKSDNGFKFSCNGKLPFRPRAPRTEDANQLHGCSCSLFDSAYEKAILERRLEDFKGIQDEFKRVAKLQTDAAKNLDTLGRFEAERAKIANDIKAINPTVLAGLQGGEQLLDGSKYASLRGEFKRLEGEFNEIKSHLQGLNSKQLFIKHQTLIQLALRGRPFVDPFNPEALRLGRPALIVMGNTSWSEVGGLTRPKLVKTFNYAGPIENATDWPISGSKFRYGTNVYGVNLDALSLLDSAKHLKIYDALTRQLFAYAEIMNLGIKYSKSEYVGGSADATFDLEGCSEVSMPDTVPCRTIENGNAIFGKWSCHLNRKSGFNGVACGASTTMIEGGKSVVTYKPFFCLNVNEKNYPLQDVKLPCPDDVIEIETSRINPFHPKLQNASKGPDDATPGVFAPLPGARSKTFDVPLDPTLGYLEWANKIQDLCRCAHDPQGAMTDEGQWPNPNDPSASTFDGYMGRTANVTVSNLPFNFPATDCGQFPIDHPQRAWNNGWACDARKMQFTCVGREPIPFECAINSNRKIDPNPKGCADFAQEMWANAADKKSLCRGRGDVGDHWDKNLANTGARSTCRAHSFQRWFRHMDAPTTGACQDACVEKIGELCVSATGN